VAIVAMVEARHWVNASIVAERLIGRLSAVFGLLALALAGVGLHGLVAYVTAQRTSEIGVRIALGADRRQVRRLVMGGTLRLVVAGVAIGLPAALAGGRLLSTQLYGVRPFDPIVVSLVLTAMFGMALVAGYLPARRAVRIDPSLALRSE
jgi:ABC-type antimicrobial peptide transport system permease subunit